MSLLLTFNLSVFILIIFYIKICLHCALCFHYTQGSAEDPRVLPFPLLTLFALPILTCTNLYQCTQPTILQFPCFKFLRIIASIFDLLGPVQRSVSSVSSQMFQSHWVRHQIGVQNHLRSSSPSQAHRDMVSFMTKLLFDFCLPLMYQRC